MRIPDALSVGASLRLLNMIQRTDVFDPGDLSPLPAARTEQLLDGFGFPGFMVGLRWAPTPSVRLAVSYRSEVTVRLRGETRLALTDGANSTHPLAPLVDGVPLRTRSSWTVPRAVRLGGAYSLLSDRLTLALELKLQLHRSANDVQRMRVLVPFGGTEIEQVQEVPLGWRDIVSLLTGVEYRVSDVVPIRAGFGLGMSSTPDASASPFMPPPGPTFLVTAGMGRRFDRFDLDAGVAYMRARSTVPRPTPTGAAGRYGVHALQASLSLSYRH